VITAAALCPHPPLLFRELAGATDPVADLRAACAGVVRRLLERRPDRVVVVGRVEDLALPRRWPADAAPDVRRFGTVAPRVAAPGETLPLSLGVGRRLLAEAGWDGQVELLGVPVSTTPEQAMGLGAELAGLPGRTALLVLGEGSARRGQTAPGFLDERAFGFDDDLAAAVASGDAAALVGLDAGLADELMVLGRAAFAVLGACVLADGGAVQADLGYRADPFGVTYLVALWTFS
jgi:hypothetical protein